MFIIDITLKGTVITLSVQRKSHDDAIAIYQHVLDALKSGNPVVLELTCEQQPEKKLAVLLSEVSGVQVYEKSSTTAASGRPPGFFALAE